MLWKNTNSTPKRVETKGNSDGPLTIEEPPKTLTLPPNSTKMARLELIMPKMGESITEATILKWLKKPGDAIKQDDAILEIATDKVDSEVPSPVSGVMGEILFKEGDVVAVGKAVAVIQTEGASTSAVPAQKVAPAAVSAPVATAVVAQTSTAPTGDRFYSPLVLNIARQEGISMSELENLQGTGAGGRVSKKDILAYVENRKTAPLQATQITQAASPIAEQKQTIETVAPA